MRQKTHIDEYIDAYDTDPDVSWFLMLKRMPATLQAKFKEHIEPLSLFCEFEGKRWRVTGASRLGDIWLTSKFTQSIGYEKRVYIDDCSKFSLIRDDE